MQKRVLFIIRGKAIQEHIHQVGVVQSTNLTGKLRKTINVSGEIARLHLEALHLRVEAIFVRVLEVKLVQLGGNDLRFRWLTCTFY